jgi:hypothetical protein
LQAYTLVRAGLRFLQGLLFPPPPLLRLLLPAM